MLTANGKVNHKSLVGNVVFPTPENTTNLNPVMFMYKRYMIHKTREKVGKFFCSFFIVFFGELSLKRETSFFRTLLINIPNRSII